MSSRCIKILKMIKPPLKHYKHKQIFNSPPPKKKKSIKGGYLEVLLFLPTYACHFKLKYCLNILLIFRKPLTIWKHIANLARKFCKHIRRFTVYETTQIIQNKSCKCLFIFEIAFVKQISNIYLSYFAYCFFWHTFYCVI